MIAQLDLKKRLAFRISRHNIHRALQKRLLFTSIKDPSRRVQSEAFILAHAVEVTV